MMKHVPVGAVCGALCGLLLLVGSAAGQDPPAQPETRTVTVTGKSALRGEIARDEAIRDALRNAVEQAAGVFIASQSRTENFQLVKDVILSRAGGFVTSYKVLKEGRDDEGVYAVTVEAVVATKTVADTWLEVRGILIEKGMPRMMVHIPEFVDGGSSKFTTAQAKVESYLLRLGFHLVDKTQVKENDRRELEAATLNQDLNKIAAVAGRYKADIVVVGKSEATFTARRLIYDIPTYFYSAVTELRAIRTTNARLLFSESFSGSQGNRSRSEAGRQALVEAANAIVRDYHVRLIDHWIKELSKQVGTAYDLQISDISFPQVAKVIQALKANKKMITTCNLKDYRNSVAFIGVEATTATTNLALWMQMELKDPKVEITKINPGSIEAKVAAGE